MFQEDGVFCPHDRTALLPVRPDDARCGTFIDGRFLVLARLGRGGMGTVYRAWQLSTAREVALKLLADAVKAEPVALERFLREARVTASLRCPHTVRVFDYGQLADGTPYLAMELVEGETLDALLARTGALPPPRAIELVRQLCLALEEAHGLGLVHRDLKPSNIMVSPVADGGDFARVLDFGVAKVLDDDDTALTAENAHPGTPAYMAPEQARSEPVGPPADLYAVAVMLYEMLTGERPFTGTSAVAVLVQHAHTPPPRLVERCPTLPGVAALDAVLQRGLAKRPGERYADAAMLRADLDRLRAGQSPQAALALAATADGGQGKKRMLGLNFQALGCSVQLAIAVGALALFILPTWRNAEEAPPSALEVAVVPEPTVEAAAVGEIGVEAKRASVTGGVAAPASVAPASAAPAPQAPALAAPASDGSELFAAEPAEPLPPPAPPPEARERAPEPPDPLMPQPPGMAPETAPAQARASRGGDAPPALRPADVARRPKQSIGALDAEDEAGDVESDKAPPTVIVPRIEGLRARLVAACGDTLRGPLRVVVDAEGRARVATPEAPACAQEAVAAWAPGGPAETFELSFPNR